MKHLALLLALVAACRDEVVLSAPDDANAAPLALAGAGTEVLPGTTITLDGSASFDPDGGALTYQWYLVAPNASTATLSSTTSVTSTFVADVIGEYAVALDVRDPDGAVSHDQVVFEAVVQVEPPDLHVDAGPDTTIAWLARASFSPTVTAAPAYTPTYAWTITTRPPGSTATIANATSLTPTFVADAQGTYTLQLAATAGSETRTDTMVVTASTPGLDIGGGDQLLYSAALDRLVLLTEIPASISIIDPLTGLGPTLAIPNMFADAIALHPNGLRAAIGGSQQIVIVNLQSGTVEQTFTENFPTIHSMVFAASNRVYSIPRSSFDNIVTLDVATGTTTESPPFGRESIAALHPGGTALYVADGLNTSSIARYDLTSTPITLARQATPASISAPIWVTPDGQRIITGTGRVLHSSTSAAVDMTSSVTLPVMDIASLAHSAVTHEIATISRATTPAQVSWFDESTLTRRFTATFTDPTTPDPYFWTAIAYRADGARMYIAGRRGATWRLFTVSPPP